MLPAGGGGIESGADEGELDWDELLLYVRDRKVVPIVGRELLTTGSGGANRLLDEELAERLAADLGVPLAAGAPGPALQEVAFRYLRDRNHRPDRVYRRIDTLLQQLAPSVPRALRLLAEMSDFRLFISTTFDSLLTAALDEAGNGGQPPTLSYSFSPFARTEDLPIGGLAADQRCVYRIFGAVTYTSEYAVTAEDTLEFLHQLQSDKRPVRLFDLLRSHHLLFLGCGFPDWLARFFIRTMKNERFHASQKLEVVADGHTRSDGDLTLFLKHYQTEVFHRGGAVEFVEELHRRWSALPPLRSGHPGATPTGANRTLTSDKVFLSFCSDDRDQVRRIAAELQRAGVETWFDERNLGGGDEWDPVIKQNILRCSLFVPILSRRHAARTRGYFYSEWREAADNAREIAPGVPYVIPVALDDVPKTEPRVPEEFRRLQWITLPTGEPTPELVETLRQKLRLARAPQYR